MNSTSRNFSSLAWLPCLLLLASCSSRPEAACCPVADERVEVHPQDQTSPTPRVERVAVPAFLWSEADAAVENNPCDREPPPQIAALPQIAVVALTGGTSHEHEVHDCQRLVVREAGSDDRFGPLVAVYPLDDAMALTNSTDFAAWTRVSNIYNWGNLGGGGDPRYTQLGVAGGWNCLWLRHDSTRWIAALDTTGCYKEGEDGTVRSEPLPTATMLDVRESRHVSNNAHYPGTARWSWQDDPGVHYVGVKCGSAWCGVTPRGVVPNEPAILGGAQYRSIPGWFDEQQLAVLRAGETVVTPGPVGRIYPTEAHFRALDTPHILDLLFQVGFDAARMEIQDSLLAEGDYLNKYNLRITNGVGRADIWIRLGLEPGTRFRNGTGAHKPGRLEVAPHLEHSATGSVRWRWQETDETAWVSCRSGCCDVMPT